MSALPPWTHWECPKQSCNNRIGLRVSADYLERYKPTCDSPRHSAAIMKRVTQ